MPSVAITGASQGIGRACLEVFLDNDFTVIAGSRRPLDLLELDKSLQKKAEHNLFYKSLDVTKPDSVKEFSAFVATKVKTPDILINNAGLALGSESIENADFSDWTTMLDTNIKGALSVLKEFVPLMLKNDEKLHHIINLGSIAGEFSYEGGSVYCATKSAIKSINDSLRIETLGKNIKVSLIEPGLVDTEFSKVRFKGDIKRAEAVYKGLMPLYGKDIAETIYFVATRPAHVCIDKLIVMPKDQANPFKIFRA